MMVMKLNLAFCVFLSCALFAAGAWFLSPAIAQQCDRVEGTRGRVIVNGDLFKSGDTIRIQYQAPGYCPDMEATCWDCLNIMAWFDEGDNVYSPYFDWDYDQPVGQRAVRLVKEDGSGEQLVIGDERAFWPAWVHLRNYGGEPGIKPIVLAWRAEPLAEVLSLPDGPRYRPGEKVRVAVILPAEAAEDILGLYVYHLGERIPGGAVSMDRDAWSSHDPLPLGNAPQLPAGDTYQMLNNDRPDDENRLPAGPSLVEFTAPVGSGRYEIRLEDDQRFVRDAIQFEVRTKRIELGLRASAERPMALDSAPVPRPGYLPEYNAVWVEYDRLDGKRFQYEESESPSTNIDVPNQEPGILLSDTDLPLQETEFPPPGAATSSEFPLPRPLEPQPDLPEGEYRATVLLNVIYGYHELGSPIAGRGAFIRPASQTSYPPTLHLMGREFFDVGETIVARTKVSAEYGYETPLTLRLFELARDEWGSFQRPEGAEHIRTFEVGLNDGVTISDPLAPGGYALSLNAKGPAQVETDVGWAYFQVFPPEGSGAVRLADGSSYVTGQTIPVTVELPDGVELGDPSLRLAFVHTGGFTPGCLELAEGFVFETEVENASMTLEGPWVPGEYEARLYKLHRFNLGLSYQPIAPKARLLAKAPFTVSTPFLGNALRLPAGDAYQVLNNDRPDGEIVVAVRLPPNWPVGEKGTRQNLHLKLYRLGDVSLDRAVRYPVDVSYFYGREHRVFSHNVDLTFDLPAVPGRYEFRLAQSGFEVLGGNSGDIIVARAPFNVTDPDWSVPLDWPGLPEPPTDLRGSTNFSVDPFPNVFQEEYCPTEIPLVSGATLKFTRFTGKGFAEITEPIRYGQSFFIEAALREDSPRPALLVRLSYGDGSEEEVPVYKVENSPRFYRSEMYFPHWPVPDEES